jgi:tripartite-type tricarboxylate transporter receptor subunit TctC
MRSIGRILCGAALVSMLGVVPAVADSYPSKPIKMIVAYSAGGTGDVVGRIVADKLSAALGQQVIVENRAGASGTIGARAVVSADPDGYTLLLGQTAEISVNQHWLKNIGYDPDKDLQPIALASVVPLALVVPAKAPYSDIAGYLAFLKSGKPSTFASAGSGTPGYFAGEFLKPRLKSKMTHVPYKGAGPALNDLVGGHVDMYFPGFPSVTALVKGGTLKLLAVSSAKRAPSAPDVPSVKEASGIDNFDFTLWQGIFAPRGTPKEIVDRLNTEINKVLKSEDVAKRFAELGAEINITSVDQFKQFVAAESVKYVSIIKEGGLTAEGQ